MAHSSLIGGSTANRVINCPGSMLLSQRVPRQESPYAKEGTMLHTAAEMCWDDDKFNPDIMAGATLDGLSMEDNNRQDRLDGALDAVNDWFAEHDIYPGDVHLEAEVRFQGELDGCFGTADILAMGDNEVLVGDFKFGTGIPVSAKDNTQLLFYAAAAMETPEYADMFKHAETVRLAIFQPTQEGMCPPNEWVVEKEMLLEFGDQLYDALERAKDPHADICEGDWCRFCPSAPVCPKKNQLIESGLELDPRIADQLAEAMTKVEEIERWCRDVRARAHDALETGGELPGFKLVAKRASRKWLDEKSAEQYLRDSFKGKIRVSDFQIPKKLRSPAQLEKIFKDKGIDFTCLDGYLSSVSSGTTVAKEDDPRPAVQVAGVKLPDTPAPKIGK
jgi:hypothetical protein